MENEKNYKKTNILLIIVLVCALFLLFLTIYLLTPVNKNGKNIDFIVEDGDSVLKIGKELEKQHIIKSDKFFFLYVFLHGKNNIYSAKYRLNDNMSLKEIVNTLENNGTSKSEITITFKEGLNMKEIAKVIAKQTNNSYEDVLALANDDAYINELINKYWFITKDIKNAEIYYSLEGYLFPDSYNFESKNTSVKTIFETMLNNTDKKLSSYKELFNKTKYTPHQILTLASVVELEAISDASRKDVAGVFYNRLNKHMTLGSDVTTYYGVGKSMTSDLTEYELSSSNGYNTRAAGMEGKLPVGPICNPSLSAIKAALNPNEHDYYYFVADRNGKVYLTKTYADHEKIIAELKSEGLWLEW